jgi:hypothetical protein
MARISFTRLLFIAGLMFALTGTSSAGIFFSINIAPPPLPIYEQPLCPGDGYIWTPGYWAYGDDGFFWVPGTWVLIPEPGLLWTPGYWGWGDGVFVFHEGYWGPRVGFYGGINYGFGYVGVGYEGGYWRNGGFFYNRAVNHIGHVTNVYNRTVVNVTVNNVSYNGGAGGLTARPNAEEEAAMRDRHIAPNSTQIQHRQTASTNRQLYESVNHGRPPIAATARPGEFSGRGVVKAKAAARSYTPPTARGAAAPAREAAAPRTATYVHPNDLPAISRPTYSGGNSKQEKQYQQQQEKLFARQQQERQQLQQKQEQEHQKMGQRADSRKVQQMEQRHQQQTHQMQQRHASQQQRLQARAPQARPRK